jgi:hypothetical protein
MMNDGFCNVYVNREGVTRVGPAWPSVEVARHNGCSCDGCGTWWAVAHLRDRLRDHLAPGNVLGFYTPSAGRSVAVWTNLTGDTPQDLSEVTGKSWPFRGEL